MIPYTLLDFSGEVSELSNWDMTLIKDLLENTLWQPSNRFEYVYVKKLYKTDKGGIIVIPARQNTGLEDKIQEYIKDLDWCLLFIVGDEERLFDYKKLKHPNIKIWLMHPTLEDEADMYIGSGYTQHIKHQPFVDKNLDWFFAGQNNHERRQDAVNVLTRMLNRDDLKGKLKVSEGFTQGLPKEEYTDYMNKTKAVIAPSGIQSPDSFRVFEALELGTVPIADDISRLVTKRGYWSKIFTGFDIPFKVYENKDDIEGFICDVDREYPSYNNNVFAWWQNIKRYMAYKLNEHVKELTGLDYTIKDKITVIVVTSPIPSHPDTTIIDKCINDIRIQFSTAEILIGIDGVRPEQEHRKEEYEEYKRKLIWKCNNEWSNVLPVVFDKHKHQAMMTKKLLEYVHTPTILFVEHDTGITPDFKPEWKELVNLIEQGEAYTIRFHFEASIPEPHQHMMIDQPEDFGTIKLLKTYQWSQRPHLSSTVFYRDMINRYFTNDSRTMIEDVIHGRIESDYFDDGLMGWHKWRLFLYHPEGNIKRSYTTDGRQDDPMYEMRF